MKRLNMILTQRIVWLFVEFLLLIQCLAFGGESNGSVSLGASNLVKQIAAEFPNMVTRDTNGVLIGLSIPSKYNDDRSLRLISEIQSIRRLRILGTPSAHASPLTPVGIEHLQRMGNLVSLEFACFQKSGLNVGVLRSASSISQLQEFQLYFSEAPPDDYVFLSNMVKLTSLSLDSCSNFGDKQLQTVTNLTRLTQLILINTDVTSNGTNILKQLPSLTNLYVRPGDR
jgi:hypothetical protein